MGAPAAASASRRTSARAGTSVPWSRTPSQTSPPGPCRRQSALQTTGTARPGCSLIRAMQRLNPVTCQGTGPGAGSARAGRGAAAPARITGVSVQLNHTIVACRDQQRSAAFLTGILGLPPASRFGHFLVVEADNGVSLDFSETSGEIASQHYAFLV